MSNIDDEIESNLDVILIKFAVRVLDVYQDKENPTFGDLIDTPAQAISQLITDARVNENQRWADGYASAIYDHPNIDDPQALQAAKLDFEDRIKKLKENKR